MERSELVQAVEEEVAKDAKPRDHKIDEIVTSEDEERDQEIYLTDTSKEDEHEVYLIEKSEEREKKEKHNLVKARRGKRKNLMLWVGARRETRALSEALCESVAEKQREQKPTLELLHAVESIEHL